MKIDSDISQKISNVFSLFCFQVLTLTYMERRTLLRTTLLTNRLLRTLDTTLQTTRTTTQLPHTQQSLRIRVQSTPHLLDTRDTPVDMSDLAATDTFLHTIPDTHRTTNSRTKFSKRRANNK